MGCKTIVFVWGLLAALAAQADAPTAGAPWALLTIADGEVTVLRGRSSFAAAAGQRLEPLDIVHTGAAARVARLEFADGVVLDLGPATQVLLQPQGTAWPKERAATAYVARGWAKLRTPLGAKRAPSAGLASATLDLAVPEGGIVLARIESNAAFAFVEGGRASLLEYRAAGAPRMLALGEGHAYSRDALADTGAATPRPTPAQLRETPRALADTLPLRASQWSGRAAPGIDAMQAVQASDVALWLDSEPALRAAMRARFTGPVPTAGYTGKPSRQRSTSAYAGTRPKAKPPGPVRLARLAPTRLADAAAATGERIALSELLPTERLPAPASIASLAPWMPAPAAFTAPAPLPAAVPASAPATKPRAQARARISP